MRKLLTLLLSLCAFATMEAQVLYSCDFESAAENANWVINKTSAARPITGYKNIWNIGTAGCSAAGSLGLYICPQTDTTKYEAIASTTTDYVVAYRENINLGAAGTYKLSFDWKAMGKATDILYVYWFPSSFSGRRIPIMEQLDFRMRGRSISCWSYAENLFGSHIMARSM